MNNSVRKYFLFVFIATLSISSAFAAEFQRIAGSVEADLRQTLQLPTGPATQFISFHIPDNGLFIIVTTDFSMRPRVQTPFGGTTKRRNAPTPAQIRKALKTAVLNCRTLPLPNGKNESLYVVLVNRSLFSRPDAGQARSITYKAYIPITDLKSAKDTNSKIHTE
ncbi:MAG: hypothetical protein GXO70_02365 [Acidobacteria bacterium]|nr:hypothetical protein [Acidobacteriota bacterium]